MACDSGEAAATLVVLDHVLDKALDRLMLLGRPRGDAVTKLLADFDRGEIGHDPIISRV